MKKIILYLLIFIILLLGVRYLQKNDNRAIINKTSGVADPGIFGYYERSDQGFLYYSDEQGEKKKITIDDNTKYLRLYVGNNDVLLSQEVIGLAEFIKDQYIEVDVSRGSSNETPRALIVRQKIYVED